MVQNFQLLPPPGQTKIDTAEKPGQFSNQIRTHANVVCKPLKA
jgi:trans-cinnamate 4-monooxygenase